MNLICKSCQSHDRLEVLCKDGHNQNSYPVAIPHCLRDDFSDSPWPFWLNKEGRPTQKELNK